MIDGVLYVDTRRSCGQAGCLCYAAFLNKQLSKSGTMAVDEKGET